MFVEGDIFNISGKEYVVRHITNDPKGDNDMYWLQPVLYRIGESYIITGGENKIIHYNKLINMDYLGINIYSKKREQMDSVLYPEDQKKIEEAVQYFPMGSYQIGEIARLSALLYNEGIDVEKRLIEMCKTYGIKLEEPGFNLSKPMTLSSDD